MECSHESPTLEDYEEDGVLVSWSSFITSKTYIFKSVEKLAAKLRESTTRIKKIADELHTIDQAEQYVLFLIVPLFSASLLSFLFVYLLLFFLLWLPIRDMEMEEVISIYDSYVKNGASDVPDEGTYSINDLHCL